MVTANGTPGPLTPKWVMIAEGHGAEKDIRAEFDKLTATMKAHGHHAIKLSLTLGERIVSIGPQDPLPNKPKR